MRVALLLALLAATACGGDDSDTDDLCADATHLTWDSFGEDFVQENCQPCHSSTAEDRYGAPEGVTFDTEQELWDRAERVRERVAEGSMPPQGGIAEDDEFRLDLWLGCGP